MVPLLLQVWSQLADVWASLLSTLACNMAGVVLLCMGKEGSLTAICCIRQVCHSSIIPRHYLVLRHAGASYAALTALVPGASCMISEVQLGSGTSAVMKWPQA